MSNAFTTRIRNAFEREKNLRIAIVFGSSAASRTTAESDIDVAVAYDQRLDARRKMALIDALAAEFGNPIDVVDLLAVTGTILQQALCKGTVIIKRDKELYARLVLKMLYNQADMMPYTRRILRERAEAFANG
jgi:predicted nucleotidyltransferase